MKTRVDMPILRSVSSAAIAWAIMMAEPTHGQVIYDANFNSQPLGPLATGSPPNLPPSIIADPGATVNVVASAGNMTDKPVLLHSVPGSLACAAFYNPATLGSGVCRISWDSLVVGTPANDPLEQVNVAIVGESADIWGLKYLPSGQFSVEDGGGFHSVGSFTVGQREHFDLYLYLDSGSYQFFLNNGSLLTGNLAANGTFDLTYFRNNGRTGEQLPDMAFDNVQVVAVPEPSTVSLTAVAIVLLFTGQRRKRCAAPALSDLSSI